VKDLVLRRLRAMDLDWPQPSYDVEQQYRRLHG